MFDRFKPDIIAENITDLSADYLKSLGVKGIILDIDNTIADYKDIKPSNKIKNWLDSIISEGIEAIIVSNAGPKRAARFGNFLGIDFIARAGKPSVGNLHKAMEIMQTAPEETILAGDQIFTDILGAKRVGMISVLIKPIIMWREPPQVILKRIFEIPLLRLYRKDNNVKIVESGQGSGNGSD